MLLPIVVIVLLFCWYKFSDVTKGFYISASYMQTVPSFGQTMPNNTPTTIPTTTPNATPSTEVKTGEPIVNPPIVENTIIVRDVLNEGNLGELVIDSLGMMLYIGIGIIGVLMMLKLSNLNKTWAILCIGVLVISFIPPLLGIVVLKERWWYLAEVFLSIPLAVALLGVAGKK
jgi:hypothetical protein